MFDFPLDFARSFPANYSEFPNSWTSHLALVKDVLDVLIDGRHGNLEQLRNQRLAQPKRFVDKAALDPRAAIFGLVLDNLPS